MINFNKLRKDFTKRLHTYTADDLQAWIDMDKKRIALAEQENDLSQPAVAPQMVIGKLNGVPSATAKSKGTPVKKPSVTKSARTAMISAKARATADM